MRVKVAFTAAHLLCQGRIADMGMGSGAGSHALAALYPELEVVGVDVNATMVELAREKFRLPNLSFVEGDIAAPVFPDGSLDGVLDSSVLHHVTTFGGYRHQNAADALANQVRQLKPRGALVVRDFLDPGEDPVWLDLPADDDDGTDDHMVVSTAALFERFAREFRSLSERPGFAFERLAAPRPGWRRYLVAHKHAAEFVLRKDYRADWDAEAKEEYTYFTQRRFEEVFASLGLRVLASTPVRNPWIVRHRFEGKLALWSTGGERLEFPPTNYVVAGEKVPAGEGVRFRESRAVAAPGFLRLDHHRHRETGEVRDLVRRPNLTLDVLPYFTLREQLYVLARASYPRPILSCEAAAETLDGSRPAHYVTEPLSVVQTDEPLGQTVERMLAAAGVAPSRIKHFLSGTTYYPSPGGTQEEVRSALVEIEPVFVQESPGNASGFSSSGRVRAIEATQMLRAAQVGALPDARLELNAYDLLLRLGREPGPWIGEEIALTDRGSLPPTSSLDAPEPRRTFEPVGSDQSSGFLEVRVAEFEEVGANGETLQCQVLEYALPRPLSLRTIAVAPLWRAGDESLLGMDRDDLPAAQSFTGNSDLLVAPAWRLPHSLRTMRAAREWVAERLLREYGVRAGAVWELGGSYRPSPGLSPEMVHPLAIEIVELGTGPRSLLWVPLRECVSRREALVDGHLRIAALRAAHAIGLLRQAG